LPVVATDSENLNEKHRAAFNLDLKLAKIDAILLCGSINAELADGADGAAGNLHPHLAVELWREKPLRLQVRVLAVRIVLVGEGDAIRVVGGLASHVTDSAHLHIDQKPGLRNVSRRRGKGEHVGSQ